MFVTVQSSRQLSFIATSPYTLHNASRSLHLALSASSCVPALALHAAANVGVSCLRWQRTSAACHTERQQRILPRCSVLSALCAAAAAALSLCHLRACSALSYHPCCAAAALSVRSTPLAAHMQICTCRTSRPAAAQNAAEATQGGSSSCQTLRSMPRTASARRVRRSSSPRSSRCQSRRAASCAARCMPCYAALPP